MLVDLVAALSSGDTAAVEDLVDPAFVDHNPVWGTTDLAGVPESYALLRAATPDLRVDVEPGLVLADGELFGAEASGTATTWTHTDVVRIAGGRIVERWASPNAMHLFSELGVLPKPA